MITQNNSTKISFGIYINIGSDIFCLLGELISQYLRCCKGFVVKYHNFILYASHLQQSQLVNNPG